MEENEKSDETHWKEVSKPKKDFDKMTAVEVFLELRKDPEAIKEARMLAAEDSD